MIFILLPGRVPYNVTQERAQSKGHLVRGSTGGTVSTPHRGIRPLGVLWHPTVLAERTAGKDTLEAGLAPSWWPPGAGWAWSPPPQGPCCWPAAILTHAGPACRNAPQGSASKCSWALLCCEVSLQTGHGWDETGSSVTFFLLLRVMWEHTIGQHDKCSHALSCLYFHSLELGQRHLSSALCSLPLPLRNYGLVLLCSQFPPPFLSGPKLKPAPNNVSLFLPGAHSPWILFSLLLSLSSPKPLQLYVYRPSKKTWSLCSDSWKIPFSVCIWTWLLISFRFRYPKVPRGSSAEAARTLPAHVPDRIQQHTADSKQKYFVACCLPNVSLELGHWQVKQWVGHILFISSLLCIIYKY